MKESTMSLTSLAHRLTPALAAFCVLLMLSTSNAGEPTDTARVHRTLIPGFIDQDGNIHREKLLSYVDALHRADDANKAEARIAQLEAHLSQMVSTLNQTRQSLAQQTRRADAAEGLAEVRARKIDEVADQLRASRTQLNQTQKRLQSTQTALAGQTTRARLAEQDRNATRAELGQLITSIQDSQSRNARLNLQLKKTTTDLAQTTRQWNESRRQAASLVQDKQQLSTTLDATKKTLAATQSTLDSTSKELTDTKQRLGAATRSLEDAQAELASTKKSLEAAAAARAKAESALKESADRQKPVTVEESAPN